MATEGVLGEDMQIYKTNAGATIVCARSHIRSNVS